MGIMNFSEWPHKQLMCVCNNSFKQNG